MWIERSRELLSVLIVLKIMFDVSTPNLADEFSQKAMKMQAERFPSCSIECILVTLCGRMKMEQYFQLRTQCSASQLVQYTQVCDADRFTSTCTSTKSCQSSWRFLHKVSRSLRATGDNNNLSFQRSSPSSVNYCARSTKATFPLAFPWPLRELCRLIWCARIGKPNVIILNRTDTDHSSRILLKIELGSPAHRHQI